MNLQNSNILIPPIQTFNKLHTWIENSPRKWAKTIWLMITDAHLRLNKYPHSMATLKEQLEQAITPEYIERLATTINYLPETC